MDSRLVSSTRERHGQAASDYNRKGRRHAGKKYNSLSCGWGGNARSDRSEGTTAHAGYQRVFWQPSSSQCAQNERPPFPTVSDRGLCSYSAVPIPMPYAVEPVSLPTIYSFYQPVAVSDVKSNRGRSRRCTDGKRCSLNATLSTRNLANRSFGGRINEFPAERSDEYTSLPPAGNRGNDLEGDETNSEHRRYSDPGLRLAGTLPSYAESDDTDSAESGSSMTTAGRGNKLLLSLVEQVTELKRSNCQLFRELSLTKSDVERLRGKLALREPTGSTGYQPGMFADLVREIREANKMCEEGLFAKMKSTLDDDQNRRLREMDRLKSQLVKMTREKEESDKRLAKLEEEMAALKLNAKLEKLAHIPRDEGSGRERPMPAPSVTITNSSSPIVENGSVTKADTGVSTDSSGSELEDHRGGGIGGGIGGGVSRDGQPSSSVFYEDTKLLTGLRYGVTCDEAAVGLCGPVTDF